MTFHDLTNSTIRCEGCEWLVQPHGSSIGSHIVSSAVIIGRHSIECCFRPRINRTLIWNVVNLAATLTTGISQLQRTVYVCSGCTSRAGYISNKWIISRYVINAYARTL